MSSISNVSNSTSLSFKEAIWAPFDILNQPFQLAKAHYYEDEEAEIDAVAHLAGAVDTSLSYTTSFFQILSYAEVYSKENLHVYFGTHFSVITRILAFPFALIGLVLSSIEAIYEILQVYRVGKFLQDLNPCCKKFTVLEKLENIQSEFFSVAETEAIKINNFVDKKEFNAEEKKQKKQELNEKILEIKYTALARRVSPWFATDMKEQIQNLILDLKSDDPKIQVEAENKAKEFLNNIDIQSIKKLLIHIIGITAIAFSVIGLIIMIATIPTTAVFLLALTLIGTALSLTRYLLENGLLTQKGWNFSFHACLPKCLQ